MKKGLRSCREVSRVYSFGISILTLCFWNASPILLPLVYFPLELRQLDVQFAIFLLFL